MPQRLFLAYSARLPRTYLAIPDTAAVRNPGRWPGAAGLACSNPRIDIVDWSVYQHGMHASSDVYRYLWTIPRNPWISDIRTELKFVKLEQFEIAFCYLPTTKMQNAIQKVTANFMIVDSKYKNQIRLLAFQRKLFIAKIMFSRKITTRCYLNVSFVKWQHWMTSIWTSLI